MVAVVAFVALWAGLVPGVHVFTPPKPFLVEVKVLKGDPLGTQDGKTGVVECLAESKVVTTSGKPAFFRAGGRTPIQNGDKVVFEPTGLSAEVLPIAYPNGNVWVETNTLLRVVNVGLGIATAPGFTEQQSRTARMVGAGETFKVRVAAHAPDDQVWVEVTVREHSPPPK